MKIVFLILFSLIFSSCNNKSSDGSTDTSSSESRSAVNPNPVKTYNESVKSFETTDEFKVSLFETKETYHYLIKINYKNLDVEDTLNVPDFGEAPSVEIEKGDKRPSCIVGFLDNNKQFRESKLIYFEDDEIKIHVLKHYGVYMK